jgi:hypothetical protein
MRGAERFEHTTHGSPESNAFPSWQKCNLRPRQTFDVVVVFASERNINTFVRCRESM